jgi:hypothetical protein
VVPPARLALLVVAGLALSLTACGDDDDNGGGSTVATATVTQTVTQATPTVTTPAATTPDPGNRCPDITLSQNSGEGVFDITVDNVTCEEAEQLLRSSTGLQSWNCRVIATAPGRQTTSCSQGNRAIVFATEA